jgi:hypothetical protein
LRSAVVSLLAFLGVLPAVDLDGKAEARAIKIERIRADGMLLSERESFDLIATKRVP